MSFPPIGRWVSRFKDQEMDVGIIWIRISQFIPDLPVPIGQKAVSESIKRAQYEPRKGSKTQRNQIPFSQGFKHPSKKIEEDQADVKDKEKSVCYFIKDFHIPNLRDRVLFTELATGFLIVFLAILRKEIHLPKKIP